MKSRPVPQERYRILTTMITACDYDFLLEKITHHIKEKKPLLISPIASQTLVKAYFDQALTKTLATFDFLVPDSQWVRYSLRWLYGVKLENRVYGPRLMQRICALSEKESYTVFLYGNTLENLQLLKASLERSYPRLRIVGIEPSLFRILNRKEYQLLEKKLKSLKPHIIFIGLGSPLQEIFSVKLQERLKNEHSSIIIPVGAAFDFFAGTLRQAPSWVGDIGFEWLFRLMTEPLRLWRRYLIDGTLFLYLVFKQKLK